MADRKLSILTVDDEWSVAYSIRYALSEATEIFSTAACGQEALTKVQTGQPPFDLVITDNNMPQGNGLELVQGLREMKFPGKIIVLSAHLTDEIRRAYEALQVDAMLPKPFDVVELRQVVERVARAA